MKTGIKIVLWIVVAVFAWLAVMSFSDRSSDPNTGRLVEALGRLFGTVFGGAAVGIAAALLLGLRWRGWLVVGGAILLLPIVLIGWIDNGPRMFESAQNHSGRADFGEQPALLAVANAIDRNDEDAIRAAVKNVPDLQAGGRSGKTLLYFAVDEASYRPELVKAVATLLACGADPNYNNVMFLAARRDVRLLRTLLDAGGNPNATDSEGEPIIFQVLDSSYSSATPARPSDGADRVSHYSEGDCRDRLRLLLDRGADVNSTRRRDGDTLFRALVLLGESQPVAYADALDLLERGADFKRTAQDQWILNNILTAQRREWSAKGKAFPPEYEKLCNWLRQHGATLENG